MIWWIVAALAADPILYVGGLTTPGRDGQGLRSQLVLQGVAGFEEQQVASFASSNLQATDTPGKANVALIGHLLASDCDLQRNCTSEITWTLRSLPSGYPMGTFAHTGSGTGANLEQARLASLNATQAALLNDPHFRKALHTPVSDLAEGASLTIAACVETPQPLPGGVPAAMAASFEVQAGDRRGMGFSISMDGWGLTAAHVVGEHQQVRLRYDDDTTVVAEVVRRSRYQDVALLRLPSARGCMPLGLTEPYLGSELWVFGASRGGSAFSIARGIVSAHHQAGSARVLQTDASINPGDSGSAMASTDGRVVAISAAKVMRTGYEGIGYSVPVQTALGFLDIALGSRSSIARGQPIPAPRGPRLDPGTERLPSEDDDLSTGSAIKVTRPQESQESSGSSIKITPPK